MSEVYRYKAVQLISEGGGRIGYDPHGPNVVMEAAYDELRAQLTGALVLAEKLRDSIPGLQRQHLRELIVHLEQASERAAPSASVEPSAQSITKPNADCAICRDLGDECMTCEEQRNSSAPVERDERAAFEAAYAREFSRIRGQDITAEDIASMRDSVGGYGARAYLNGQWVGWQARAALERTDHHG